MKTIKVTVKVEMEVEDVKDKDILRENVYEHIEGLMLDEALDFSVKVLSSDDEDPEMEEEE